MSKFRRQVLYISGFDPRGAAAYHTLYREELAKYAQATGQDAPVVSERIAASPLRTDWRAETQDCVTDYRFLRWDDLVRGRWQRRRLLFLRSILATYVSYLTRYRNAEAYRISSAPLIAFYYPSVLVLIALLLTLVGTVWLGIAGMLLFPLLTGALFFALRRWQPGWLLHTFAFNRSLCEDVRDDIETRCTAFAAEIMQLLDTDAHDETLLVGHSNGATLLLLVLDRLPPEYRARLGVVTLGQFMQMITYHQGGGYLRDVLTRLQGMVSPWLDISAAADPACFALVGPFHGTTDAPPNLCVASARLHTLYDTARYAELKRDKLHYHFLYLKSADRIGAYNYLKLTASAARLEQQIATIREHAYHG